MEQEEGGRSWIRMEEEEEEGWVAAKPHIGFVETAEGQQGESQRPSPRVPEVVADLVRSLAAERQKIVDNGKLSARQKRTLLDENRKALTIATGGKVTKTDSVVYGILWFGGVVLVILALLTVFKDLPKEVTLSFVGTVLGGVIATIAQKLGRI
jgi:hypothetical protein